MEDLQVLPLHKHQEFMMPCCELINAEWKRSVTARLRSLESSCDSLPTSLVLLNKERKVIGHVKLSPIPSIKGSCFIESVVIEHSLRGKGYGSILMKKAEEYCRIHLNLSIVYLATKGQEGFYKKLGYDFCEPVNIFGSFIPKPVAPTVVTKTNNYNINVNSASKEPQKVYMNKVIAN